MVELEHDIGTGEKTGSEELSSNVEPGQMYCGRCRLPLWLEQEEFDIDSCHHVVCVACRFRDDLRCILCGTNTETDPNSSDVQSQELLDLLFIKNYKKKKFNTDHIVDVELSSDDSNVQNQMCTVCKRVFKKSNARYHYACATGDKPFSCIVCGQKFVKKNHLESHLNSHYGIKPYKCTAAKCKASFTQKDKLTRHMKSHDKEVKFHCPVCNKPYSSQPILNHHLAKVHSSLKPFQCEQCPRSYKYHHSLRVHRLKHQAKREYMCEICGKKYALFAQLRYHKRSHVAYNRRPHKCRFGRCMVRCMTRRDRARHELIHSTSLDFECSLCNTTFGRKDNLERHMKNFHQAEPPDPRKVVKLTAVVSPFNKKSNNTEKMDSTTSDQESSTKPNETSMDKKKGKSSNPKSSKAPKKRKKNVNQDSKDINKNQVATFVPEVLLEEASNIVYKPPSVIVSPKLLENLKREQTENINRPSVIKNIPKLLPYRVLPPDKRFLKMTEEITKGKSLSELMPPPASSGLKVNSSKFIEMGTKYSPNLLPSSKNPNFDIKRKTFVKKPSASPSQKRKTPKDDALDRCFRIICHTNSVPLEQNQKMPLENLKRLKDDISSAISRPFSEISPPSKNKLTNSSVESVMNSGVISNCSFVPENNRIIQEIDGCISGIIAKNFTNVSQKIPDMSNNSMSQLGGPSLAASIPENTTDINHEDNFTSPFVPLGDCYSSYAPYFDNECFRESGSNYYEGNVEHLLPNDLDIGFQYINEQLSCTDLSFTSESRIVKHISQESKVVRESFS